jgi:hypothetical protein
VGLAGFAALGALLVGAWWAERYFRPHFGTDAGKRTVAFMESLGLESGGVMVAPYGVARDYALRHYPLRLSMVPRNSRTLRLLAEKHPLHTIMVATDTPAGSSRRYLDTIRDLGLVQTGEMPHPLKPHTRLLLFEREHRETRPGRGERRSSGALPEGRRFPKGADFCHR